VVLNKSHAIKSPVGAPFGAPPGPINLRDDVQVVQMLLNEHAARVGFPPVQVTGMMTPETITAIKLFQQKVVGMRNPDGRVDPSGGTLRKLNEPPGAPAPKGKSRVSGKTAGVKADIIAYLEAVAEHYGKDIQVVSGLRSPEGQAQAMWDAWAGHLERGTIYAYLQSHPKVQEELDGYHVEGAETPSASPAAKQTAKQKFFAKVVSIGREMSRHLTGEAVDVALSTDAKVLEALKVGMTYLAEKNKGVLACHHFDNRKHQGKVPDPDQDRAKWPK
jgi:peptidoglycan hydrolase-like protein with peptidoglycan-binding domain